MKKAILSKDCFNLIQEKTKEISKPCLLGILVGSNTEEQIEIWSMIKQEMSEIHDKLINWEQEKNIVKNILPHGLSFIGICIALPDKTLSSEDYIRTWINESNMSSMCFMISRPESDQLEFFISQSPNSMELKKNCLEIPVEWNQATALELIRCTFVQSLSLLISKNILNTSKFHSIMTEKIQKIQDSWKLGSCIYFGLPNGSILSGTGDAVILKHEENYVKDIFLSNDTSKISKKKSQKKKNKIFEWEDTIGTELHKKTYAFTESNLYSMEKLNNIARIACLQSLNPVEEGLKSCTTMEIAINSKNQDEGVQLVRFDLPLDIFLYIGKEESLKSLTEQLVDQMCSQLQHLSKKLIEVMKWDTEKCLYPFYFHVLPNKYAHPLTMCICPEYKVEADGKEKELAMEAFEDEEEQKKLRLSLHEKFYIPTKYPVFRSRCSMEFEVEKKINNPLRNVHQGIKSSGVQGGKLYMIDGAYEYYHYMQQNFDDKGWGCAYRSLQTICSWLKLNHYSNREVPTHNEIQETLVKIGDKPKNFIGSKEWIGSMEVGYCLDELYNVSFRSLMVSSGHEMSDKGRELARHFEQHGTPVMMGGGALALTIIGIDFNASTGDISFLILDPHYTGRDDLDIIQKKSVQMEGYKAIPCSWRKATTFAKNSFYNLCLPQRPSVF